MTHLYVTPRAFSTSQHASRNVATVAGMSHRTRLLHLTRIENDIANLWITFKISWQDTLVASHRPLFYYLEGTSGLKNCDHVCDVHDRSYMSSRSFYSLVTALLTYVTHGYYS